MAEPGLRDRRAIVWDALLSLSGVVLVGLTFRLYRYYEPAHSRASVVSISPSESNHRISDAKAYLSSHPDDIHAWTELAIGYYQQGPDAYVDGLNALEKARALGSTDESLFFYAGVMYEAVGLPDYAINELKKYLRYYPDHYEALVRLANVYFHTEKFDEADALYQQVIKQWPRDPTIWFNDAVVCIKKGRADDAQKALQHVQELAGKLPVGGLFEEGEVARLKGDDATALAFYTQELQIEPDHVASLEAAERIQRQRKNYKEANELHKRSQFIKHSKTNG